MMEHQLARTDLLKDRLTLHRIEVGEFAQHQSGSAGTDETAV